MTDQELIEALKASDSTICWQAAARLAALLDDLALARREADEERRRRRDRED